MTNEDEGALARAIKDAAEALTKAVDRAAAKGLKTELRLLAYGGTGRTRAAPSHFVAVTVTKEL